MMMKFFSYVLLYSCWVGCLGNLKAEVETESKTFVEQASDFKVLSARKVQTSGSGEFLSFRLYSPSEIDHVNVSNPMVAVSHNGEKVTILLTRALWNRELTFALEGKAALEGSKLVHYFSQHFSLRFENKILYIKKAHHLSGLSYSEEE